MFDATSHTLLSRLFRCPSPPAELDTTLRPFFAPLPDPAPPRRSRSLLRRLSTRTSRTRSPPRRARQIIDPEPTQDYIYASRPTPARRPRRRNTISMTTRYDLREPQTTAQNPIYPALYPDPSGAVHGYPAFLVTPAPTYTPLPYQHRMAPASHAYHGPAQGYVPAAAPAATPPHTPTRPSHPQRTSHPRLHPQQATSPPHLATRTETSSGNTVDLHDVGLSRHRRPIITPRRSRLNRDRYRSRWRRHIRVYRVRRTLRFGLLVHRLLVRRMRWVGRCPGHRIPRPVRRTPHLVRRTSKRPDRVHGAEHSVTHPPHPHLIPLIRPYLLSTSHSPTPPSQALHQLFQRPYHYSYLRRSSGLLIFLLLA
ncbi:hypothetical protein PENSPDRAFT_263795 [Peniophora sp. CONT]|nr:hypothetical protein PENSPDRAFT_263795 [Peniophora sp. CONT]